jgi:nucleoside 2-deoxyribosyltransferase
MRVYIAGHDIFRADAAIWAESVRDLLARHGHQALIPLDGDEVTACGIYQANIRMILSADAVLANLNPFRGDEPDSGTCFEVGFAIAQGLSVIGYLSDGRRQIDKVGDGDAERPLDANGQLIENFGLPLNLMLAIPCRIVVGDLSAAVAELSTLIS